MVLAALVVGKPIGVYFCSLAGRFGLGLQLPKGMDFRDTLVVGSIAGIGFTVALFVSGAAFPRGTEELAQVKMGALGSFGAAIVAFIIAKMLGIKKYDAGEEGVSEKESESASDPDVENEKEQEEPALA